MDKIIERARDYEVAQILGRRMEVDKKCRLHIYWGRDGEEVEHVFDDIAPAARQEKHVLEDYLGFEEEIRGRLLVVPGESEKMDALVRETMDIAREFLRPGLLTRQERERIRGQIEDLIARIGAVRNAHKRKFRRELEFAHVQTAADLLFQVGQESDAQIAAGMYEAAEAGLARLEDIARKVWGVGIRFQTLLQEEERVRRVIKSVYGRLHRLLVTLKEDGDLTQKDLEQIANQVCGGKNNLVNGLESVWIPPYGFRIRSREVQRLKRVGKYATSGDKKATFRALLGAFKKLRPVVKEMQDRRKAKAKRWIPR